jgi:hypothetical protein
VSHAGSVGSNSTVRCRQPRNADRVLQDRVREVEEVLWWRVAWGTGQRVTLAGHESKAGAARRRQARLGAGKAARRWCVRQALLSGTAKGAAVGTERRSSRTVSECWSL